MSILATELDWPEGTKFFEVRCRLGIWDVDGWDLDKEPEVKTLGGTVRITPRTPAGRIRILEPDGRYRVVVTPPLTFAIDEFTGKLVNTADNTEGVWVVDPSSYTVDPKDFTYSAVVTPKVGSPFTVEFDGSVAINGVYDLANGTTVAPSRGVSVLESRIAKLEQEGGLPHGDIPIFATVAEMDAYMSDNPGKRALTLEPTTPDTTPPTPGTLEVVAGHTTAELSVTGALDDRAIDGYSFRVGSAGIWSAWQPSPTFRAIGLTGLTSYSFQHKVRDRAGNESVGEAVQAMTTDKPPIQAGDVITSDSFTSYADGTPLNGKFTDASLGGSSMAWTVSPIGGPVGDVQALGGSATWVNARSQLTLATLDRYDWEVSFTINGFTTDTNMSSISLRRTTSNAITFRINKDRVMSLLMQGPAIGLYTFASRTIAVGDRIVYGVKGNSAYVSVNGAREDIPDLGGLGGINEIRIDSGPGLKIDDVVVTAL